MVLITGAVAPETPGIQLGRNFTMERIKQQRWSKLCPELRIVLVSLQEIGTPVRG
ncbi:unnamed protein product [marine sediment metagenome]|uniref:Uncharacterized protein n=1 Tax=marine sediment metagenome TaxID=412755 RepID=X1LG68_9ZZZZ